MSVDYFLKKSYKIWFFFFFNHEFFCDAKDKDAYQQNL